MQFTTLLVTALIEYYTDLTVLLELLNALLEYLDFFLCELEIQLSNFVLHMMTDFK